MLELFCLAVALAITGIISFNADWFSSAAHIWKIVLVLIGDYLGVMAFMFALTFVVERCIDVTKPIKKPSRFHNFVYIVYLRFLDRFFRIKLVVKGEEKLPKCPALYVFNHRSNFDPMLVADRYRKRNILMISKPQNFRIPIAGGFIHKAGYMAIDRENDREALKTILKAIDYLGQGYSVGVFPEGTRNKNGLDLLPFHAGVFKIALKANVPIVVMTLHDTQKVHVNFPLKRTKVYLNVLKVITPEEYEGKATHEISQEVFDMMQADIDAFKCKK